MRRGEWVVRLRRNERQRNGVWWETLSGVGFVLLSAVVLWWI